MTTWIVIGSVVAGTYALRLGGLLLVGDDGVPDWMERPLGLLGPAALTALVVSILAASGGGGGVPIAAVAAVVAGFFVARRSGNMLASLAVGMPTMWVFSALGL